MLELLRWASHTLMSFHLKFSRDASYNWFIVVIFAMMIRTDTSGVTSIIRDLNLNPSLYETLVAFFHASSYTVHAITWEWMRVVNRSGLLFQDEDLPILIVDGLKQTREGKKIPGVKKLYQESENSNKASYIYGHHYGVLGVLIGNAKKLFCTPLSARIHNGVDISHPQSYLQVCLVERAGS